MITKSQGKNREDGVHHFGPGKDFWNGTQKVLSINEEKNLHKLDLIKMKQFFSLKAIVGLQTSADG